jgi:hypothetical protein
MGRFLCAFKVKDEENKVVLRSKMFTTKTDDVEKGKVELLVKISQEYNIPAQFVDKHSEDLGILYINPHKYYCPAELCDENIDETDE